MSRWEGSDHQRLAQLLAGDYYGDRPHERLDEIRVAKQVRAAGLCRRLACTNASVVLEIGSGMGFTSKHVASRVRQLYCCDISESFLGVAREECAGIANIEFIKLGGDFTLPFADEHFDAIFADAVFIHLNLYDIFWYFSEFQRVAKKGARININVMNASKMDLALFAQMAGYYRPNKASLETLLCWHSLDAVVALAAHFGLEMPLKDRLRRFRWSHTVDLLFVKR